MDRSSYGLEGADNTKGAETMKMYFEKHPQYPLQPRQFPPHYIDTTQQPEDTPDTLQSLGGLFGTTFGLVLGAATVVLVALHFYYGPPF